MLHQLHKNQALTATKNGFNTRPEQATCSPGAQRGGGFPGEKASGGVLHADTTGLLIKTQHRKRDGVSQPAASTSRTGKEFSERHRGALERGPGWVGSPAVPDEAACSRDHR